MLLSVEIYKYFLVIKAVCQEYTLKVIAESRQLIRWKYEQRNLLKKSSLCHEKVINKSNLWKL